MMTDQPIKRGRGSSTLDRPLDEQVFGESRIYTRGPGHRRSSTNLAFGSRMASDRGVDLNSTTTSAPGRSGSARPLHRGKKTTIASRGRPPPSRPAAPSPMVRPSRPPFRIKEETVRSPPSPRVGPRSPPTTTTIKYEHSFYRSPSPKRSRVKTAPHTPASTYAITRAPMFVTADTTVKDNFAPVQPTSAVDSTVPYRSVKYPDSDDEWS